MAGPEGVLVYEHVLSGGRIYQGGSHALGYLPLHGIEDVALLADDWQPEVPGASVLRAPFRDIGSAPPGEAEEILRVAREAAAWVADRVAGGRRVLSSCRSGLNRSGLVSALAIIRLSGLPADMVVALIRERRSPHALNNAMFERFVLERGPA